MDKTTDFYSKLPQNKAKTRGSVYRVNVPMTKNKQKAVKADQDLLRRLLVAANSGRDVNLGNILQHEPVPLALAGTNQFTFIPQTRLILLSC